VIAIISGGMEFAFLVAAERGDFVDMQEIMRAANASDSGASANPPDWQSQGRSPLLPWWWFLWIVTILLSQAFF
jgi:hypothetical protein